MRVILQRVKEASVVVDQNIVGKINKGYLLFAGFTQKDDIKTIEKIAKKIISLRIFADEKDKINLDIKSVNGDILLVSQFTLYAKLNGRRPSFTDALNYKDAEKLYNYFIEELNKHKINVETGIFGVDMSVNLVNDGPVTIIIDSEDL